MITHPIPSMHEDIKKLWKKTFGDSDTFLDRYFERMYSDETMLVCVEDDEEIVAMMTMLPITLKAGESAFSARYIYAVATDEDWRGLGISTTMMECALDELKESGVAAAILVPAHFSLFPFYERQGFETKFYATEHSVKAEELIEPFGTSEPLTAETLFTLRNKAFSNSRLFAQWDEQSLDYIIDSTEQSGGTALKFSSPQGEGYAIASVENGICSVKELGLFGMEEKQALSLLHKRMGANLYLLHRIATDDPDPMPYAMIQWLDTDAAQKVPKEGEPPYFALAMD